LDHELVEFVAKVPAEVKVQNNQPKYLMRKLAANYLPAPIVRREKQGFMLPIAYWFRTELFALISQMLENSYFVSEGWFRRDSIQRLLDEHRNGRYDHHVRLWLLLTLELWHQIYIEGVKQDALEAKLRRLCLPQ
jgi:asparagine synthase (glutamine-hydrolysing)